jgi:hypothetical protein
MPASDRFLVAFALEQVFPAFHLRIFGISDFEPRRSFSLGDIDTRAVFRNYPFQVHLADTLEQRGAMLVDMVGISQSGDWGVGNLWTAHA